MINQAIDLAREIPVKSCQQRLAAICVDKKGRVIGQGKNSYKRSHPLQKHFAILAGLSEDKMYLHAELQALLRCKDKQVHTLYVARVLKDGSIGMAKPCAGCVEALKAFGVEKVVYTLSTGFYNGWVEMNVESI